MARDYNNSEAQGDGNAEEGEDKEQDEKSQEPGEDEDDVYTPADSPPSVFSGVFSDAEEEEEEER